jgi:hypothetical protein
LSNLTFQISKSEILRKISNNLGVTDITKSSQLSNLADGLLDITQTAFDQISETFQNNFIETCDEQTLDKIGLEAGLPRYIKSRLRISQSDSAIELTIDPEDVLIEDSFTLLKTGELLTVNSNVVIRITSDIIVTTDKVEKTRVIIGGIISSYNELSPISLTAGTSLSFTPNVTIRPNLVKYNINFLKSITSTVIEESYEDYRARLLAYSASPKYGTELAIDTLVANYPYVDRYYIDTSTYPVNIYLLNQQMYYTSNSDYLINNYAIAALSDELNMIAAHNSVYKVLKAKKVNLKIMIETEDINLQAKFIGTSFIDFLYQYRTLGETLYIDEFLIEEYLSKYYDSKPTYSFQVFYSFSGFLVTTDVAEISPESYPYIEEVYHSSNEIAGIIGDITTNGIN